MLNPQLRATERAQVFAWYDYLKRELPDVFFVQSDANYPINFAAQSLSRHAEPLIGANGSVCQLHAAAGQLDRQRPGHRAASYGDGNRRRLPLEPGLHGGGHLRRVVPDRGRVVQEPAGRAAERFRRRRQQRQQLDRRDRRRGNGTSPTFKANHTHATARAEMLYAILVEGAGPWGSVFSRDEFTDREVQDTDGDGLPEFVDAWGQPLQFFRWPMLLSFRPSARPGDPARTRRSRTPGTCCRRIRASTRRLRQCNTAGAVFQERERDPLDPNQQLTAPQWWSQTGVGGQVAANDNSPFVSASSPAASVNASGGVQAFEYFFHRLTEPISPGGGVTFWDRGGSLRAPGLLFQVPDPLGRPRQAAGCFPVLPMPT